MSAITTYGWKVEEFQDIPLRRLYEALRISYDAGKFMSALPGAPSGSSLRPPADLPPEQVSLFDSCAFLAERDYAELSSQDLERELQQHLQSLRARSLYTRRQALEEAMREAERAGDHARVLELAQQFSEPTSS